MMTSYVFVNPDSASTLKEIVVFPTGKLVLVNELLNTLSIKSLDLLSTLVADNVTWLLE